MRRNVCAARALLVRAVAICAPGHREVVNWAESFIVAGAVSGPGREGVAEHRQPAFGLLGGGLVLDDIPVFDQDTACIRTMSAAIMLAANPALENRPWAIT